MFDVAALGLHAADSAISKMEGLRRSGLEARPSLAIGGRLHCFATRASGSPRSAPAKPGIGAGGLYRNRRRVLDVSSAGDAKQLLSLLDAWQQDPLDSKHALAAAVARGLPYRRSPARIRPGAGRNTLAGTREQLAVAGALRRAACHGVRATRRGRPRLLRAGLRHPAPDGRDPAIRLSSPTLPNAGDERFELTLSALLYPPSLMRAPSGIRRRALSHLHPAVLGVVCLPAPDARRILRREIERCARREHSPDSLDAALAAVELESLEALIGCLMTDRASLFEAPPRAGRSGSELLPSLPRRVPPLERAL